MREIQVILSQEKVEQLYTELVDGVRKYFTDHGFSKAVLGLSGGIDSAIVACLAKQALGAKNVLAISLPSKYSSQESADYAKALASNLDIQYSLVSIAEIYDTYLDVLGKEFHVKEEEDLDIYLQNIQSRIRGNILMAFSNKFGGLVLATGNKSEALMGYCTLYGDTVGALAVIADVLKTNVYQLAEYINTDSEVIPGDIITRHPTAELSPGQKDEDSLPPYEFLDKILYCIGKGKSETEIVLGGSDPSTVKEVIETIKKTEYKREQCPPGIKTSI